MRLAFEFRSQDWYCEDVYAVLRANNWCLCIVHLANHARVKRQLVRDGEGDPFYSVAVPQKKYWGGDLPDGWSPRVFTADFAYFRLHGPCGQYVGEYGARFCREIEGFIRSAGKRDNFVMFNNTDDGCSAVWDALATQQLFK